MFSNIFQIHDANDHFWIYYLFPMLEASRRTHESMDPSMMMEGFVKFDQVFNPYVKYCLEHSNCLQYVKEKHKENELFKTYVVVSIAPTSSTLFLILVLWNFPSFLLVSLEVSRESSHELQTFSYKWQSKIELKDFISNEFCDCSLPEKSSVDFCDREREKSLALALSSFL